MTPYGMSDLLPPFHKVMESNADCHLANDRVAMLEAELKAEREHPTSILQCAACQRLAVVQNVQLAARAELAEAELAERERMLRLAAKDHYINHRGYRDVPDQWLADLRARAEEGSRE